MLDFFKRLGICSAIITVFLGLTYLLVSWSFKYIGEKLHADEMAKNKDCYYFVPDPNAAKEGENQWLRLEYNDVINFGHHVSYKIDGIEYKTTIYIFCRPNND